MEGLKIEHRRVQTVARNNAFVIPKAFIDSGLVKRDRVYTLVLIEEKPEEKTDG